MKKPWWKWPTSLATRGIATAITTSFALPRIGLGGQKRPERLPEFAYQVGYTRYKLGRLARRVDLPDATYGDDTLAQNAAYHMADCYLELGDRHGPSRRSRRRRWRIFDLDIQEDAFFHYAKLAYELSFNPFDDAIVAFETYLEQFPSSPRRDEAYRFLLQVHMTSRDYERALQALDNIVDPDETVRSAAQLLAFNRAVELFQNKQPQRPWTSSSVREKTTSIPSCMLRRFTGKVKFVTTRVNTTGAAAAFAKFSTTPGSYLSDLHNDADYARGYAHYKSEKYTDALSAFRSYLEPPQMTTPHACATPNSGPPIASTP